MGCRLRHRSIKFFYRVLTGGSYEQITEFIQSLEQGQTQLEREVNEVVVYSNGAVSWTEVWQMSPLQRSNFIKTLNKKNAEASGDEYL